MCQGGKKNGQSELGSDGYIRADFMGWSSRKWEKSNGWPFLVLLKREQVHSPFSHHKKIRNRILFSLLGHPNI